MVETPDSGFGDFRMLELLLLLAGYHDYSVSVLQTFSGNYVLLLL